MSSVIVECVDESVQKMLIVRSNMRGYETNIISSRRVSISHSDATVLNQWINGNNMTGIKVIQNGHAKTYLNRKKKTITPQEATAAVRPASRSWFKGTEYATIYGFPAPNPSQKVVVGVMSLGGGLFGTLDANKILTNGDCQAYWTYLGIPTNSQPTVKIVELSGATNTPSTTDGSTGENSLDVQMIGAACPSSNLTIILYLAPNTFSSFSTIMNYMLNTNVNVNGSLVKPNIISISWGAPEVYYGNTMLNSINSYLLQAANKGIPVCAATGDNGSNDGVGGSSNNCDFPSSSPNVIACGGTNLVCPNYVYDGSTTETTWSSGGGGISSLFAKPSYQSALSGNYRKTPDIAMAADPNTGVVFIVGGQYVIYGGTSVVAPAMAGYLAAINARVFPNPRLYTATTGSFHDITSGSNGGFAATAGFDNCTGLGSIKGSVLTSSIVQNIAVTGVTLSPTTVNIGVRQTSQLTPSVAPTNATNTLVSYSTSNSGIATVSATGLITGVSSGSATVTCTTSDGSFTATCAVTVSQNVTGVTISSSTNSVNVGSTLELTANIQPSSAANKSVTWSSSNTSIATVNSSGLVSGVAKGSATISVRTADGGYTASLSVTVVAVPTSVTLSKTTLTVKRNTSSSLTATVLPSTASNKLVSWSSNNTAVATVSSIGTVRGASVGTATITVTTASGGLTATCRVTVN